MKLRLALAILFTCVAVPAFAQDLTGTWKGQMTDPMGAHPITIQFREVGGKLLGTMTGGPPTGAEQPITDIRLKGAQLSFTVRADGPEGPMTLVFTGKVSGNRIKGTQNAPFGAVPWEVTRQ
jgi:hypothetical protein